MPITTPPNMPAVCNRRLSMPGDRPMIAAIGANTGWRLPRRSTATIHAAAAAAPETAMSRQAERRRRMAAVTIDRFPSSRPASTRPDRKRGDPE